MRLYEKRLQIYYTSKTAGSPSVLYDARWRRRF